MALPPFNELRLKPGEKPNQQRLEELFDGYMQNIEDLYRQVTTVQDGTSIEGAFVRTLGGAKKLATGLSSWTWTASTLSATKVVPHGLGVPPTWVGLTPVFEPTTTFFVPRLTGTPNKTEFGSCAVCSLSITNTIPFQWVAIG